MTDYFITLFENLPTWLGTLLLATLPVVELRGAIPAGILHFTLDPYTVYGLSVIGNILPFFPLFFGLIAFRDFMSKHSPKFTNLIDHFIERSQKRVEKKYARYGAFALFLFTAIPLPFTGLWTATVAAVALKVPFKYTVLGIIGGVLFAGVIVTFITLGSASIF